MEIKITFVISPINLHSMISHWIRCDWETHPGYGTTIYILDHVRTEIAWQVKSDPIKNHWWATKDELFHETKSKRTSHLDHL
jgi:hypothetical protein